MIVATAGHVDHGKSTVVRALTGTDPDRWAEEHRRGLTIDLGFAELKLPSGRRLGFVDVPGHERFARNMLVGCASVDLALLVVSGREGWRAQSEEHLWALRLCGVREAVVALTHADVATADELADATAQTLARLAESPFAGAPVVRTSPDDTAALAQLTAHLDEAADRVAARRPRRDAGRPRLWVDRSFTVSGAGRVVTGVLEGGSLAVDEELVVVRGARRRGGRRGVTTARVRGLRRFDEQVAEIGPGHRVAVNLAGIKEAPERGDALVTAQSWNDGTFGEAHMLHALAVLRDPASDPGPTRQLQAVIGTSVLPATARVLRSERQADGSGAGLARVYLSAVVAPVRAGDRFLLRDPSPGAVIAGGVILETDTRPRDLEPEVLARRAAVANAPDSEERDAAFAPAPRPPGPPRRSGLETARRRLERAVGDHPDRMVPRGELRSSAGITPSEANELLGAGLAVAVGDRLTTAAVRDELARPVMERLAEGPATTAELRDVLGWSRRRTIELLEALDEAGLTVREQNLRRANP